VTEKPRASVSPAEKPVHVHVAQPVIFIVTENNRARPRPACLQHLHPRVSRRHSKSLNDYYRLDTKDLSSRASFSRSLRDFSDSVLSSSSLCPFRVVPVLGAIDSNGCPRTDLRHNARSLFAGKFSSNRARRSATRTSQGRSMHVSVCLNAFP